MSFFSKKSFTLAVISLPILLAGGCQSLPKSPATSQSTISQPQKLTSFNINGKIGVTSPSSSDGNQGGSAFYAWGQENDRFAIELIGALGIGKTNISYDGQSAT